MRGSAYCHVCHTMLSVHSVSITRLGFCEIVSVHVALSKFLRKTSGFPRHDSRQPAFWALSVISCMWILLVITNRLKSQLKLSQRLRSRRFQKLTRRKRNCEGGSAKNKEQRKFLRRAKKNAIPFLPTPSPFWLTRSPLLRNFMLTPGVLLRSPPFSLACSKRLLR